jgi:hypothetical protein
MHHATNHPLLDTISKGTQFTHKSLIDTAGQPVLCRVGRISRNPGYVKIEYRFVAEPDAAYECYAENLDTVIGEVLDRPRVVEHIMGEAHMSSEHAGGGEKSGLPSYLDREQQFLLLIGE